MVAPGSQVIGKNKNEVWQVSDQSQNLLAVVKSEGEIEIPSCSHD